MARARLNDLLCCHCLRSPLAPLNVNPFSFQYFDNHVAMPAFTLLLGGYLHSAQEAGDGIGAVALSIHLLSQMTGLCSLLFVSVARKIQGLMLM